MGAMDRDNNWRFPKALSKQKQGKELHGTQMRAEIRFRNLWWVMSQNRVIPR
jgi:hypothetical protein